MATINDKDIIFELITSNGHYEDDPQTSSIWKYLNKWGDWTQAIFYHDEMLEPSIFVRAPELLWKRHHGITLAGEEWVRKYKEEN